MIEALRRRRAPVVGLRDAIAGIAVIGMVIGPSVTLARWRRHAGLAAQHAAHEEFCRGSAATFRTREHWNPAYAESATAEAERQAALKRSFKTRW